MSIAVGIAVVSGLIGMSLWAWMAVANRRGRSWARVTGTVFGGLGIAFGLLRSGPRRPEETRHRSRW